MFVRFALVFVAVVVLSASLAIANQNIPAWEVDALRSLYDSTDGYNWAWRPVEEAGNTWNFSTSANPCADSWQGVVCSSTPAGQYLHVTNLLLANYSMHGTLPAAIGNLTYLEVLSLPHNKLYGSIPDSPWASMPNLTTLDLGRNRLHGSIPSSLSQLSNLTQCLLDFNRLTGSIPPGLGTLTHLTELSLTLNRLNGSIPAALTSATQLVYLLLNDNRLTGSIPASIGQLIKLEVLYLQRNLLAGTIPSVVGQLAQMRELYVFHNSLTGSIPTSIGQLSNLTHLGLQYCTLTGTIPASLCQLHQLQSLRLYDNYLTGSIPACIGNLAQLEVCNLNANSLEGALPPSLGEIAGLVSFELEENYLTGTVPVEYCALAQLYILALDRNSLSGTIPSCLVSSCTGLYHLSLNDNKMEGPIPESVWQLPDIGTIWLDGNSFTGPIGDFSSERFLAELDLVDNYLTGIIPDAFESASELQAMYLSGNLFTGSLPASLGTLAAVELLQADRNMFTGTLPSFTGLHSVLQLQLNNNHLSGSLDGVFSASGLPAVQDVFLNDNQLTGTLPDELFLLPQLRTIVAQGNCFTGTLSAAMCESPAMVSLILDGLHTSTACRRELLAATHSYTTDKGVHGTIPACLFSMPNLVSLHLAGNDLTGSLPDIAAIRAVLVDVTVSHNMLTGTIPSVIQEHIWQTLDLSYNRLSGSVQDDFGSTFEEQSTALNNDSARSLSLQNNRLSGRIPSSLVHLQNVSVLGSNMFACKIDKSDLPKHDGDRDNYQCGSDAFNGPFYVVLIITAFSLALLAWVWYPLGTCSPRAQEVVNLLARWVRELERAPANASTVILFSDIVCRIAVWCTALIILVLVPWYAGASNGYSTYTYEYAWAVSAAFLSGVTPLVTEMVLYCAILLAVAGGTHYLLETIEDSSATARLARLSVQSHAEGLEPRPVWQRAAVYSAFIVVNVGVVVGVNAGFVAVALTQSNAVLVFAQIIMSLFKLLWSTVCTPKMIALVIHYLSRSEKQAGAGLVMVQVFVGLFNNIAIPCLVVAALSPSCFYGVFDAAPAVTSSYAAYDCYLYANIVVCSERFAIALTSTFSPPFRYDYQCSSSFITYYAPAFVYLGLAAAVAAPSTALAGLWLHCRASTADWARRKLNDFIPYLLNLQVVKGLGPCTPVLDAHSYFVALITYLGILLTFGVVFPPLAVVMCATMLSVAWQTKLSIGRFLHFAREQSAPQLAEAMERDCKGAVSAELLRRSVFLIMCFACCFYALFLFDTLGDAVGLSGAYWVLFVMPVFPAVLYPVHSLWLCRSRSSAPPVPEYVEQDPRALELTDLPASEQGKSDGHSELEDAATYNVMLKSP